MVKDYIKKVIREIFGKKFYDLENRVLKLENDPSKHQVECYGCGVAFAGALARRAEVKYDGGAYLIVYFCHRCIYGEGPTITIAKKLVEQLRSDHPSS